MGNDAIAGNCFAWARCARLERQDDSIASSATRPSLESCPVEDSQAVKQQQEAPIPKWQTCYFPPTIAPTLPQHPPTLAQEPPHHLKSKAGHQILSLQSHISFHLKISPLCTKDEMHNSDWQHQPPGYISKLSSPCKIFPPRSISSHLSLCEQSLSLVSISLVRKTQS